MNKVEQYKALVSKRKEFQFLEGLLNPSQIKGGVYDSDQLGPWSSWQGNLGADILLIGQDWGDERYFIINRGCDIDSNPTSKNINKLFKSIDIDVGTPSQPNNSAPTFFTNAILGIKENGGMSGKVKGSWARQSTEEFLVPLIGIIEPKIIITLGVLAYKEVAHIYSLPKHSLKQIIGKNPIKLADRKKLYAMYHCGGLGLANRNFITQTQDWNKIDFRFLA